MRRLSQRWNRLSERDIVADHLAEERFQRVKKKLVVFYVINVLILALLGASTALWWKKADGTADEWRITTAKCIPSVIFSLFTLFNVWIQCSNRSISRDIIHPWVNCRCHLYIFLIVLPFTITAAEVVGLC